MNMDNLIIHDFIDELPLEELFDKLRELLGTPDLEFKYEVIERDDFAGVRFETGSIKTSNNILNLLIKNMYLYCMSSIIVERRYGYPIWEGDVDLVYKTIDNNWENTEIHHFAYTQKDGLF